MRMPQNLLCAFRGAPMRMLQNSFRAFWVSVNRDAASIDAFFQKDFIVKIRARVKDVTSFILALVLYIACYLVLRYSLGERPTLFLKIRPK